LIRASAEEMLHGTECMAIARLAGARGALIEGDDSLWKVGSF